MNLSITAIDKKYISNVTDVHLKAFPSFFLSFLGPRFLREFYGSFLSDPVGIGFVAENEKGEVIGVIVGPLVPDGYFKRLLIRRWWAFCLASIAAVLKNPSIIKRLFRAVFYRGEAPAGQPRALLSSIAVAPEYQGKGIGEALVKRWAEEVKTRAGHGCYLTTDAVGNDKVNNFYKKLGWKVETSYITPEGRKMNRYVIDF